MTRRALAPIALVLVAAGAAILIVAGGDGDQEGAPPGEASEIAGDADPAEVEVIRGWVDTLRRGDVEGAAGYFAIPSTAENGPTVRIESVEDAERFNRALPCGAVLIRAEAAGEFTTATFRLTERPGPGTCGTGTGETAQTTFVIEDGEIVEWRRVATGGQPAPSRSI